MTTWQELVSQERRIMSEDRGDSEGRGGDEFER